MEGHTLVSLDLPLFRGPLSLARVPKYLRFVCVNPGGARCSRKWDALDQLDDEPEDGEHLFAAVLGSRGTMHVDRTVNGRRVGEWHETATYDLIDPQPPQEVMRDREKWQAWCLERESQSKGDL